MCIHLFTDLLLHSYLTPGMRAWPYAELDAPTETSARVAATTHVQLPDSNLPETTWVWVGSLEGWNLCEPALVATPPCTVSLSAPTRAVPKLWSLHQRQKALKASLIVDAVPGACVARAMACHALQKLSLT
jgi:hypothetical protein